jgi:hypothetical protein
VRRSIFDTEDMNKYYDQIAWFENRLHLQYTDAGHIDFCGHVYQGLDRADVQYRISDHYPLWIEFECRNRYEIETARRKKRQRRTAEPSLTPPPTGSQASSAPT